MSYFPIIRIRRKMISKNWKIGDMVMVSSLKIKKRNELHVLVGWSSKHVYIQEDGLVHECNWDDIVYNLSSMWVKNYDQCEKFMGTPPNFVRNITSENIPKKPLFDAEKNIELKNNPFDKPIDMMNETECEIYLKIAIEEEDFKTASLIRKRLENFK